MMNPPFIPNHERFRAKKQKQEVPKDEHRMCPLAHEYDPFIHDALSQLRILDGSQPVHRRHGPPVNFFAPKGEVKFWVKADAPVFGFFLYLTLDKVIGPYLANMFEMAIFHPQTEAASDELLAATVGV